MEWLLIIIGILLMIGGLLGCIIPILPGPPISFLGLLILQLRENPPFDTETLLIWLAVTIIVTALDYLIPAWGTKKYGGSKQGVWGSFFGLLIGLFFFPPLGIIFGSFLGALTGEYIAGKDTQVAVRSAFGAFIGLLTGTILKLIVSGWMMFLFFNAIF